MENPPIPHQAEQVQQTDLVELMGERIITLFGVTDTVENLAKMCPVDASDPRMNLEAKNEFIVKAVNEAGEAIEPELAPYFTEVLEKSGKERKFTIFESVEEESIPNELPSILEEPPEPIPLEVIEANPKTELIALKVTKIAKPQPKPITKPVPHPIKTAPALQSKPAQKDVKVSRSPAKHIPEAPSPVLPVIEATQPVEPIVPKASPAESIAFHLAAEISSPSTEVTLPMPMPEYIAPIEIKNAEALEIPSDEVISWSTELYKEPLDQLEDFSQALETFTAPVIESEESLGLQEEILPIVATISERLSHLEDREKELVAPIIKNIIGAIHGIHILEAQQAAPENLVAVEVQLKDLCIMLFETLTIEYTEENIQQFVRVMLSPDFQPQVSSSKESIFDLAQLGTHEVKHTFGQFTGFTDISRQLHHAIGIFALFYARKTEAVTI